jgi:hypothetical protein
MAKTSISLQPGRVSPRLWSRTTAVEATAVAVISLALSLLVFGPILRRLNDGLAEGDMLATYVNVDNWSGFGFASTTRYGFPFGMDLNLFPSIDITQNTFASLVSLLTGSPFLGINLLLLLSFPLVAVLAYFAIRLVGLNGALAIGLAVAFTMIPYHWGRGLGHMYLATLYAAVTGVILALLIGTGRFDRWVTNPHMRQRVWGIVVIVGCVVITAWSGVYYAAFALILGAAAIVWRIIQRDRFRAILRSIIPVASIGILAIVGFIPALLTLRASPPFAPLGIRLPYESVIFAGNTSMLLAPAPTSRMPFLQGYNTKLLEAVGAAPALENTTLPNFGSWVTTAALLVFLVVLARRITPKVQRQTLAFIAFLITVTMLFFIPWGLNYIFAATVTPQIRAWNRLVPILLLLFILGAAAALARTKLARRPVVTLPVLVVILLVVTTETVLPFRPTYAESSRGTVKTTDAARAYNEQIQAVIPEQCAVLQLPYVAFPEQGPMEPDLNDYEHFWQPLINPGKDWSYGAVKNTPASVWSAQLPQLPTDEQLALLASAGFCGIHLDRRGFRLPNWRDARQYLTARIGAPVATGKGGDWAFYALPYPVTGVTATTWNAEQSAFFRQPRITAEPETLTSRGSRLDEAWWWATSSRTSFTFDQVDASTPISQVVGEVRAPTCGSTTVVLTLRTAGEQQQVSIAATPDAASPFAFTLEAAADSAQLNIAAFNTGCPLENSLIDYYVQILNVQVR